MMATGGSKIGGRLAFWLSAAPILIIGGFAAALINPGTPTAARSLRSQGYVPLPKGGALSILDDLTIRGGDLFVTNVSSDDVYKIALEGRFRNSPFVAPAPERLNGEFLELAHRPLMGHPRRWRLDRS